MKYVYAYRYFLLGELIQDLKVVEAGIRAEPNVVSVLVRGIDALNHFIDKEDPEQLRSSIEAATDLRAQVESLLVTITNITQGGRLVPVFDSAIETKTKKLIHHFESILGKELRDLPLFCAEEKGGYDLRTLVQGVSRRQPSGVTTKITARIAEEIDESGRCLAFSRTTASAFHILRALELLVLEWMSKLGISKPAPNRCNWGEYISLLRTATVPKQATDLLQMIKDNYRNPTIHPEDTVDLDSAISLFGICQSAIEVICRQI